MSKQIFVTYELISEESASRGTPYEHGYVMDHSDCPIPEGQVGGEFMQWCSDNVSPAWEYEAEKGDNPAEIAAMWLLRNGYSEHSSSAFDPGGWYSWADSETNMHSGDNRMQSAHLEGFSTQEQAEIYKLVCEG